MGNEDKHENRSSAFSPEQLAAITTMMSASIRETIAALAPTFKDMALTPEKLREATRPFVDPLVAARQEREMKLWKQDEAERIASERATKNACVHLDKRGQSTLRPIRNYPDRQPRGICMLCHDLINPKEWRIGAPDKDNPRGKPYYAEPHKDYKSLLHVIATE